MTVDYSHYKALKINRPKPRLLEIVLSQPGKLNALDADGHRELAEIWRDVDRTGASMWCCCAARAASIPPAATSS